MTKWDVVQLYLTELWAGAIDYREMLDSAILTITRWTHANNNQLPAVAGLVALVNHTQTLSCILISNLMNQFS